MIDQQLDAFLDLLREEGWSVELRGGGELNESFSRRYPRIPEDYARFLRRVALCANADDTVWFLCADDYNDGMGGEEIAWNRFEQIELEAAEGNEGATEKVRDFWNRHLPIMMSVGGDYAYLALRVSGDEYGSVVDGYEPSFHEVTQVAPTFAEFIRLYSAALKGDAGDSVLVDYV